MRLHFSGASLNAQSFRDNYNRPGCKFFIFQYTFVDADAPSNKTLTLQCYPADENLNVYLNTGGDKVEFVSKIDTAPIPVNTGQKFNYGNITVEKTILANFFGSAIPIVPEKFDEGGISYIRLIVGSIALASVVLNPSPPARRV